MVIRKKGMNDKNNTYIPNFYLLDSNVYIETKGYW